MTKKELILTVAKDLLCAYKFLPESHIKVEKSVDGVADILSQMAKRVEKIYSEVEN